MASGLKINFAKIDVMGVNIEERNLRGAFVFNSIGKIPFDFLGIPIGANA